MPAPDHITAHGTFRWEGLDRHGHPRQGMLNAADAMLARAMLRRQGIRVARLQPETDASVGQNRRLSARPLPRSRPYRPGRVTDKQVALFTRHLATMLQAGLPLLQALDIAIRGAGSQSLASMLRAIRRAVSQGDNLHGALASYPRCFDALFCNLVRAAEEAGMLDTMLERIALYREKSLALKGKVRSALTYPITVVLVALIITAVIMTWVVPAFEQMFRSFGADLPLPTRIVLEISRLLGRFWPWALALLLLLAASATQAWRHSPRLRAGLQRASLRLPLFGNLLRKAALARWSRTFSTLLGAGIPLLQALETVAGAAGHIAYEEASFIVRDAVRNGASLHGAMETAGFFPDLAIQMVAVGEEAGALEVMLGKIADLGEREVDDTVATLTSLMEPFIMTVLGLLIGALVVAMYLPVFQMGSVV